MHRNLGTFLSTAVVACLAFSPAALGQSATTDSLEDVRERGEALEEVPEAQTLGESGPVDFADIVDSPDDPSLNLQYAEQLVAEGKLSQAAATLERILLLYPDSPSVRLFYGVLLYRLDDLASARLQIEQALAGGLAPEQTATAERLLGQIAYSQQDFRGTLDLGLGVHYDTNRNAGPRSGRFSFFGIELDAAGDVEDDDVGFLGVANMDATYDFGTPQGHLLRFDAIALWDEQLDLDTFDTQYAGFKPTLVRPTEFGDLMPALTGSYLRQDGETYVWTLGAEIGFERPIQDGVLVGARLHGEWEEYHEIESDPLANENDGAVIGLEGNAVLAVAPEHRLNFTIGVSGKAADEDWQSYKRFDVQANHLWLLGFGQFLSTTVSVGAVTYDAPDLLISATDRSDVELRGRVTYGVPLSTLTGFELLESTLMSLSGEYTRRESSIVNYEYENVRGEFFVTHRLRF